MNNKKKIAVIGSGVAGLSATWLLHKQHNITLFEKNDYLGGHTHTIDVQEGEDSIGVDTGFIVYNEKNYPNLVGLFNQLGIKTQPTEMSFAFSMNQGELEYSGSGIGGLFAQRSNWLNPKHWYLLREILRFNQIAHATLKQSSLEIDQSLGQFLDYHGFTKNLKEHYLLPMGAAIWSCPVDTMLKFPVNSFLRFFANHGLIDLRNRPVWRSVCGGSSTYVKRMMEIMGDNINVKQQATRVLRLDSGVEVQTVQGSEAFDQVIFACHADQVLKLLGDASVEESQVLGSFQYQENRTYLHTDARLMPKRKAVWSAWNYLAQNSTQNQTQNLSDMDQPSSQQMTATYWMNKLQHLESDKDYLVTLNPYELPRDETIIAEMIYEHPVFDQAAIDAQGLLPSIQGINHSWFCGSYARYGFHEDAISSAVKVCKGFGVLPVWYQSDLITPAEDERVYPNGAVSVG